MSTSTIIRTVLPTTRTDIRPEIVAAFVTNVVRCLRATIGVEAVVATCAEAPAASSISVALEFEGDISGPVTWVFPPAIALELVRRLLAPNEPPPDSANDGATELANILTGRATEVLEAHGFRCEMGAPRLHEGALPEGLQVRMQTPKGPIDLVLSLARTTSDAA